MNSLDDMDPYELGYLEGAWSRIRSKKPWKMDPTIKDSQKDLLGVLEKIGRPATLKEILSVLAKQDMDVSEGTSKIEMSELVRRGVALRDRKAAGNVLRAMRPEDQTDEQQKCRFRI